MNNLENVILDLCREKSIKGGPGMKKQVIVNVIINMLDLKKHPNVLAEIAEALGNLIREGYLDVLDKGTDTFVLTESGHKEVYT